MATAALPDFQPDENGLNRYRIAGVPLGRLLFFALAAALLLGIVWFIYSQLTARVGVPVEDKPPQTQVDLIPPPPPPPPEEAPPPEPTDTPEPVPDPSPAPQAPDQPAPMTIAGDAAAGASSGLAAGSGGGGGRPGGTGTCLVPPCGGGGGPAAAPRSVFNDGFYRRYLGSELQRRVQRNADLANENFEAVFNVTVAGGRVTAASLVKSSGDSGRDAQIREALLAASGLTPPPAEMKFPQRVVVRSRRG